MFTEEEIEAVTEKLLPTGISRTYDALGTRKYSATFDKIQQSAASVLLLYPNSPYYLASLFASELMGEAQVLGEACARLMSLISALRRRSVPVKDITSITNARTALVELEGVIAGTNPPSNLNEVPSFNRFSANADRFIRKVASNIRQKNQIVPTPEEARNSIPLELEGVIAAATAIREKVTWLRDTQSDFHAVDLARRVSTQVVRNARILLTDREATLKALSESDRLVVLRETVLELLAARGIVRKMGSFPAPSTGVELFGTGAPYADAARPGVGGELVCRPGPYYLTQGDNEGDSRNLLYLRLGGALEKVTILATVGSSTISRGSGSWLADGVNVNDRVLIVTGPDAGQVRRVNMIAALTLTLDAPVLASPGAQTVTVLAPPDVKLYLPATPPPRLLGVPPSGTFVGGTNDTIRLEVNRVTYITATFAPGAVNPVGVAAAIAAALIATPFTAITAFAPLLFEGPVAVLGNTVTLPYGNFPALFQVGSYVQFTHGLNAGQVRQITALNPNPTTYNSLTVDGAALTTSTDRVRIGDTRSVQIVPVDPIASLLADHTIAIRPTTDVHRLAGLIIGIAGEQLSRGTPVPVQTLASYINANTSLVRASARRDSLTAGHALRSKPEDARKVVVWRARGTGTWTAGSSSVITGAREANSTVVVGDKVVLRDGFDTVGTITAVAAGSITASFVSPIVAGSGAFDVGASLIGLLERGDSVEITSGVNNGVFAIDQVGPNPLEVILLETLPISRNFDQPLALPGFAGTESLVLRNAGTVLPLSIAQLNPTNVFHALDVTPVAYGTATAFKAPHKHANLGEGDILELYTAGNTTVPSSSRVVSEVSDGVVLVLDGPIPETPTSYAMGGADVLPTPSAVVRNGRTYDFGAFRGRLEAWLKYGSIGRFPIYLANLNRFINVILKNKNPTDTECGDAEQAVLELYELFTEIGAAMSQLPPSISLENILASYSVDREIEVDGLLRTYKSQGADRAYDLILSCRFTQFFGLTTEELTYGGAMQKAIRDVSAIDLPVDKFDRREANRGQLVASVPSTDFEFDISDTEDLQTVDPPE